MSIEHTFILQFYMNTLFMNMVGECYLPSRVRTQYFSIIFNEKSVHYLIYKAQCIYIYILTDQVDNRLG